MSSSSAQKSSVAQRCNLLSQFFRENGRFANKGVETMNLLPNLENSSEISRQNTKANNDFFANIPSSASTDLKNNDTKSSEHHGTSNKMTIFYAGKVFVFSDFPEEKAKEIMALATKASSNNNVTSDLTMAPTSGTNSSHINVGTPVQFKRASLQRFFEKRKDRVAARAPYQVKGPSSSSSMAAADDAALGLELEGPSSKQLDLNL